MKSTAEIRFEDLTRRLLAVTFDLDTKEILVIREGRIAATERIAVGRGTSPPSSSPERVALVRLNSLQFPDGGPFGRRAQEKPEL
jgi:hypothetical protein